MKHILVVEDNEINQDLIRRRLEKKGFRISLAANGEVALDMAALLIPDIILLDMSLPLKDGWQVVAELKQSDVTINIPVIALTAHAMSDDREKALKAGCDEYETKPIQMDSLLQKINDLTA